MIRGRHLFTSESVTEGHPDKVADQISDAILDYALSQDPLSRVACETMVTTGVAVVAGEITTKCYIDYPKIVRETVEGIGYTDASYGFDSKTCAVMCSVWQRNTVANSQQNSVAIPRKNCHGFEAGQPKTPWQKSFIRDSEFAELTRTNCRSRIAFA